MTKAQILVVEDDGIVATDLENRLKKFGYSVPAIVSSGEKAISNIEEHRPDLVLMDVVLKGETDGIETAEIIRSRFGIPVIFLTAYADEERFQRAKLTVPFGYILKPFQDRDLKITIEISLYAAEIDNQRKRAEEALRESEGRMKLALEGTDVGIWDWDVVNGDITLDDNWIRILGYEPGEINFNFDWWDKSVHPKSKPVFKKALSDYLKGREKYCELEYQMRTKSGSWKRIWARGNCVAYDNQGNPLRFIGTHRDITERKQSEEERIRLSTAVEQAAEAIIISDRPGIIQYINPAFEQLSGFSREEIVGQNFRILKSDKHNESFYREMWDVISSGQVWAGNITNRMKDGTLREFETRISPISDSSGEIINFVSVNRDVTKEVALRTQLRQAQRLQSIGTLAGGIAHDFNNILFPIVGFVEMMLEDTPENSPYKGPLNEVLAAAMRAGDLVKQILTFSRQTDKEFKPLKMQLILKEVLKLTRSSLPSTIKIKQYIEKDCGYITADPTQIHQLAMNLITNAFHAMEERGGELEVTLKEVELGIDDLENQAMNPGPYACLTVADTGIGMERSVLDRIFEPYFTTKEKDKGTGLGLAVVHGIVKSHKGDIKVYSELEKGTAVHVYIPVIQTRAEAPKTDVVEPIEGGTERILFVDDEAQIVRMEKQMLKRFGYRVTARTSSLEALEAFRAAPDKFDLVITDMTMPNMTGVQLTQELLNIRSDIPIIICTGFSEQISEDRAKALGICGFVMKPVVKRELAKKIRAVLD